MHFSATLLLLIATTTSVVLAAPAQTRKEIERRWAEGESEVCFTNLPGCYVSAWIQAVTQRARAQIHKSHDIREASPAWPMIRDGEASGEAEGEAFAYAPDEQTMQAQRMRMQVVTYGKRSEESLLKKLRAFVTGFMRSHGEEGLIEPRGGEEVEAPVLKPRKGMRYRFA